MEGISQEWDSYGLMSSDTVWNKRIEFATSPFLWKEQLSFAKPRKAGMHYGKHPARRRVLNLIRGWWLQQPHNKYSREPQ
jgi:hypothetical protein